MNIRGCGHSGFYKTGFSPQHAGWPGRPRSAVSVQVKRGGRNPAGQGGTRTTTALPRPFPPLSETPRFSPGRCPVTWGFDEKNRRPSGSTCAQPPWKLALPRGSSLGTERQGLHGTPAGCGAQCANAQAEKRCPRLGPGSGWPPAGTWAPRCLQGPVQLSPAGTLALDVGCGQELRTRCIGVWGWALS